MTGAHGPPGLRHGDLERAVCEVDADRLLPSSSSGSDSRRRKHGSFSHSASKRSMCLNVFLAES